MSNCPNFGTLTKWCAEPGEAPHTFDTSSEPYRFYQFGVRKIGTIMEPNSILGTRSHVSERTREGPSYVAGQISMAPSPLDLDRWLERGLGGTKSGNTIALTETIPYFGLLAEYYTGKTIEYKDCKLRSLTIRGNAYEEGETPQPVEMILDVVGKSTAQNTAFPVLTYGITAADKPYIFEDLTTTQVGTARKIRAFVFRIVNDVEVTWRNGSLTPVCLRERDRLVTVQALVPYTSDNADLYDQSAAGTTGNLVLTNGSYSLTLTFGVLQAPSIGPAIQHRGEILLPVNYTARMTGTTRELVATNVSSV